MTDPVRTLLRGWVVDLVGINLDQNSDGKAFLELGADSLLLLRLTALVRERWGVPVSLRDLLTTANSVDTLVEFLNVAGVVDVNNEASAGTDEETAQRRSSRSTSPAYEPEPLSVEPQAIPRPSSTPQRAEGDSHIYDVFLSQLDVIRRQLDVVAAMARTSGAASDGEERRDE